MSVTTENELVKPMLSFMQKPLVAVVDDVFEKHAPLRYLLEYMGCAVQEFYDGEDFLANGNRESACVLLNEQMPGRWGHQIFHQMRKNGWLMPVISESGSPSDEQIRERYRNGQVAHLRCPYKPSELEDAIRTAIGVAGYCLPPKGAVGLDFDLLTWSSGTIPLLALSISEKRGFNFLPILADALEEAGCKNADILNHCRQPCEHLRGCWALDRIYALYLPDSRFEVIVCDCKQRLRVPNHLGELEVRCPRCQRRFGWSRCLSQLFVA